MVFTEKWFADLISAPTEGASSMQGAGFPHGEVQSSADSWHPPPGFRGCRKVVGKDVLAEYRGNVFNAERKGDVVIIWRYVPTEGFERHATRRGTVYYERTITAEEAGELFDVTFMALMDGRKFVVRSVHGGIIDIICDDCRHAEENGFAETDHGVWSRQLHADAFSGFVLMKCIENSRQKDVRKLNAEEFAECWKRYVEETGK